MYVTFDGTVPSSTNGNQVYAGNSYHWHANTAAAAQFVQIAGAGTVQATELISILGATQMPVTDLLKPKNLFAGSFASLTVTGAATIGGALAVTGLATLSGGINATSGPNTLGTTVFKGPVAMVNATGGLIIAGTDYGAGTGSYVQISPVPATGNSNPSLITAYGTGGGSFAPLNLDASSVNIYASSTAIGSFGGSGLVMQGTYPVNSVQFQTGASTASLPTGTISFNATNGLTLIGKPGSSYDFYLGNGTGSNTICIPTGTTNLLMPNGTLFLGSAGNGLNIKTGANSRLGQANLTAGSVTIANTSVTVHTVIFLSNNALSGTAGALYATITAGTGFVIHSTSGTDTSTVSWMAVEQS
jgi:hypothetical protein